MNELEDPQKTKCIEQCRSMFNDLCVVFDEIVRLIGFEDDGQDYYYVVRKVTGEQVSSSMVGACYTLKGHVPYYNNINDAFKLNRCPEEPEFVLIDHLTSAQKYTELKCPNCRTKIDVTNHGFVPMAKGV